MYVKEEANIMMTYDKETRTIRIERGYWKPVTVFLRNGSEQVRSKKIGGYEILFELPKDGTNEAMLRTPLGVRKVRIKATKKEVERDLFRITNTTFQIGEIAQRTTSEPTLLDSLEALEYVLDKRGNKAEQIKDMTGWIEKFILLLSMKFGLLLDSDDVYDEERKALRRRPDFEYGKDYSFLYSDAMQKAM